MKRWKWMRFLRVTGAQLKKTVHEEALTASDTAPQIYAFDCLLAREQPYQRSFESFEGYEVFVDPLQVLQRCVLRLVRLEAVLARVLPHPCNNV